MRSEAIICGVVLSLLFFFFQAEDGIRYLIVTGVQTCALPILGSMTGTLAWILRWPVLFLMVLTGLAILYRYGPSRREPRWEWLMPGTLLATIAWLDRKSTRLNSSHDQISYAVFCLKKKKQNVYGRSIPTSTSRSVRPGKNTTANL